MLELATMKKHGKQKNKGLAIQAKEIKQVLHNHESS